MLSQIAVFLLFMAGKFSMVYMDHIFFIHSAAEGHSGCFHVLGTMNNAVVNMRVSP